MATASSFLDASPEVSAFCRRHGISDYVLAAVDLARTTFGSDDIILEAECDPEAPGEWVVLHVTVKDRPHEEVLDAYRAFSRQRAATIPWRQRELIRLSFNVLPS